MATHQRRSYGEVCKGYTGFLDRDVLVAKITPCFQNGKIAQVRLDTAAGFGSTEFHVIRAKPNVAHPRYLLHFLRQGWIRTEGERRMTGSAGQRRVPAQFLSGLEIPVPDLAAQSRIAGILDRADSLLSERRAAMQKLESLTHAIFHDMCGRNTPDSGRWPQYSLGELLDIQWGNTSMTKSTYVITGVPAYSASGQDGFVAAAENVGEGIVLSAIGAKCGKCFYVEGGSWTAIKNTITIRRREGAPIELRYLIELMNRTDFWPSKGAGQPFITLSAARAVRIQVPPLTLQRRFTLYAARRKALHKSYSDFADLAEELFASLQHRAFRGEL